MNLKTIPDGIAPRDVQEKISQGLTQDQAVDVLTIQHEWDLAHPSAALGRLDHEEKAREAQADKEARLEKERAAATKEHAKSEETAAELADKQKAEQEAKIEEMNAAADEKKRTELEEAKKAKGDNPTTDDDLEDMTVADLKELAEKRNVDLTGLTKKSDIIDALRG